MTSTETPALLQRRLPSTTHESGQKTCFVDCNVYIRKMNSAAATLANTYKAIRNVASVLLLFIYTTYYVSYTSVRNMLKNYLTVICRVSR